MLRPGIWGMLHPEVHYGSADHGAAIAYATVGSGPVSLVLVSPMVSQLGGTLGSFDHPVAKYVHKPCE